MPLKPAARHATRFSNRDSPLALTAATTSAVSFVLPLARCADADSLTLGPSKPATFRRMNSADASGSSWLIGGEAEVRQAFAHRFNWKTAGKPPPLHITPAKTRCYVADPRVARIAVLSGPADAATSAYSQPVPIRPLRIFLPPGGGVISTGAVIICDSRCDSLAAGGNESCRTVPRRRRRGRCVLLCRLGRDRTA